VSGAPKVRAMELIAELEKEKRGVYAGAVGYFGYNTVTYGEMDEGAMDT
jgi:anthranilate synthase component 1